MRSSKTLLGCGIAVIAVLVLSIAGIVAGNLLIPDVSQQMTSGSNRVFINVTSPLNGASLPLNQPFTVFVEAFGDQPIQGIELNVNGVLVPNGSPTPAGGEKMMSTWTFTPDKAGVITLVASAAIKNGVNSISNAVHINVVPADQIPLPLVEGEATAPEIINDETGEIELAGGIPGPPPPGFNDQGGMDNPPPPPPEPEDQTPPDEPADQPGSSFIPIKFSLWGQNLTRKFFGTELPAAPRLDGGAKQCDAILVVQDNSTDELGFFLYRLNPGSQFFQRVATLDGKKGKSSFSYHDPGLAQGSYSYYLSAFNAAGEAPGNIITLQVSDGQCSKAVSQSLTFENFKLKPKTPVDQVYCYISADGSPWWRVPQGQNSFIQSDNGEFDLNPYLGSLPLPKPPQTQISISIECWGWNGGTLTYLGSGQQSWKPGETLVLAAEFFEISGSGGGGQKVMSWPHTDLLSAPWNARISRNPDDCSFYDDLTPLATLKRSQKCVDEISNGTIGAILVWNWRMWGEFGCKIGASCYETVADGFRIYGLQKGSSEPYLILEVRGDPTITYITADYLLWYTVDESVEFFVRAFSDELGESDDSNHIPCPDLVQKPTTIPPTSIEVRGYEVWGSNYKPPQWVTYPPNPSPFSGYAFTCLSNCSTGYRDNWIYARVSFTLPEKMITPNATLNWKNVALDTKGSGKDDIKTGCSVHLGYQTQGDSETVILPNFLIYSEEHFDVSQPILASELKGKNTIDFWFLVDPSGKPATVRPDVCLWYFSDISLTLWYGQKY
jgi:hypothetical protein